jgi:hypothetical protein
MIFFGGLLKPFLGHQFHYQSNNPQFLECMDYMNDEPTMWLTWSQGWAACNGMSVTLFIYIYMRVQVSEEAHAVSDPQTVMPISVASACKSMSV